MPAPLAAFAAGLAALLERGASEAEIVERGGALLPRLLSRDDRLPAGCAEPDPARYRPCLLYRDPAARFAVVSFVWGAGHTRYGAWSTSCAAPGSCRTTACSPAVRRFDAGMVDAVSPAPGDVHQVRNAYSDRVSISIHACGVGIGAIERAIHSPDGAVTPFRSAYANAATRSAP